MCEYFSRWIFFTVNIFQGWTFLNSNLEFAQITLVLFCPLCWILTSLFNLVLFFDTQNKVRHSNLFEMQASNLGLGFHNRIWNEHPLALMLGAQTAYVMKIEISATSYEIENDKSNRSTCWCANNVYYLAHMAFRLISLWTTKMSSGTLYNNTSCKPRNMYSRLVMSSIFVITKLREGF